MLWRTEAEYAADYEANKELHEKRMAEAAMARHQALRDQFAMAALTGLLASPNTPRDVDMLEGAASAYMIAEAMLAAREAK